MNQRTDRPKFWIPPWMIIMFFIFGWSVFGKLMPLLVMGLVVSLIVHFAKRANENPPSVENRHLRKLAIDAMDRAGYEGGNGHLQLDDIGILMYDDGANPRIYRTAEIPTTASHIRPFIVLNQPVIQGGSGRGTIRFNLVDGDGNLRFTNRSGYLLKAGQNFVTPPTWLPLDGQAPDGLWSLQVTVGAEKFATMGLVWLPVGGEVRTMFNGDGELDERMVRLMERRTATQTMSLDELLGDQVEEAPIRIGASR
jgi:hypothetical protein